MPRVICPFCAGVHGNVALCPETHHSIPRVCLKQKKKPLWLLAVGLSGHGKSTLIASLVQQLEVHNPMMPDTWVQFLDDFTQGEIKNMRRRAIESKAVDPTPKDQLNRPLLFNLLDLPEFGTRSLVLYDLPGQAYDSLNSFQPHAKIIKQVNTLWFVVDLRMLEKDEEGRSIGDLFNNYTLSMEQLGADLEGWTVIVVYTKADQIRKDLGTELEAYLSSDPFQHTPGLPPPDNAPSLDSYFEEMMVVSERLKDFTLTKIPNGDNFIKMAKAAKMKLVFTVNTALGSGVDNRGRLQGLPKPIRVIDPFLWALRLSIDQTQKPIHLIYDNDLFQEPEYDKCAMELWESLSDLSELKANYLGWTRTLSNASSCPKFKKADWNKPALLGPSLERCPISCLVVVLTGRSILDLVDVSPSIWGNRLLILDCKENYSQWERRMSWSPEGDVNLLTQAVIEMSKEHDHE